MKGRPLGLMKAWLEKSVCETKEEHWASLEDLYYDLPERQSARERLMMIPNGRELANVERELRPDEAVEPPGP